MGEGKTTVISPLLALLLADGSQLLMQIVPAPLLAFSLGVLRSVFGSGALRKPVWTFAFDRRAQVTPELLEKAHTAVAERAVMVSTPAAVKAFMLKLLELLHLLDSGQYPRNHSGLSHRVRRMLGLRALVINAGSVDKDALHMQAERAVLLQQVWRRAVAVIDEVDVVLHPLRSELNWPLGDKYALDFAPERWELPWHLLEAVLSLRPAPADAASASSASASAAPTPGVGGSAASKESEVLEKLRAAVRRGVELQLLQRVPHLVLLSEAYYQAERRP